MLEPIANPILCSNASSIASVANCTAAGLG